MSICNRRHAPRTGPPGFRGSSPGAALRAADMRDASSGWRTSHGGDLGFRHEAGPCGPGPDGGCACALAFSTLLSSQGADAHHRSALAGFRGNPSNLPASSGPVKSRSQGFGLACQLAPSFSLPAVRDHPFPGSVPQAVLLAACWSEGAVPPAAFRVPRGRRNIRQQSGFRQIGASPAGHPSFT